MNIHTLKATVEKLYPGWKMDMLSHFGIRASLAMYKSVDISDMDMQDPELVFRKIEGLFPRRKGPTATKTLNIRQPWFTSSRSRRK